MPTVEEAATLIGSGRVNQVSGWRFPGGPYSISGSYTALRRRYKCGDANEGVHYGLQTKYGFLLCYWLKACDLQGFVP